MAGIIAVLGGMTATAVDLGSYAAHRRDLQNAADAVALAAAQELPDTSAAQTVAQEWAQKNGVDLSDLNLQFVAQNPPSEPNPKVIVTVEDDHEFFFARLVGITESDVAANATGIRTSPGGADNLIPLSVQESELQGTIPGDPVTLKYDARNVTTGNFGPLAIDGTGANIYRETLKHGSESVLCAANAPDCNGPSVADTEPGNMTGPTRQGIDYRIDNTTSACDTWNEVITELPDDTHHINAACNPFGPGGNQESKRIVVVPVIDSLCNGRCEVTIIEFALFFLEGYEGNCTGNSCEIVGRFMKSNTNYGALTGVYDPDSLQHFVRLTE
jgi:hypothetical protein